MFRRELKSPPRIALMTDTAWKSGIRRGSPTWPTRIAVRLAGPTRGPVIRRIGRVDRFDERLLGPTPRICPSLEEVIEPLVAKPFHFAGGEGGMSGHLGQQPEGRFEPL